MGVSINIHVMKTFPNQRLCIHFPFNNAKSSPTKSNYQLFKILFKNMHALNMDWSSQARIQDFEMGGEFL